MNKQTTPPPDPDWSRSQSIDWCIRDLHNLAMAQYTAKRTRGRYQEILEALKCAKDRLEALVIDAGDDNDCEYPWCDDGRDRCVPCDWEPNGNGGGGGGGEGYTED